MIKTNIKKLYCITCERHFEKERSTNSSNAAICSKCNSAASVVTDNHPFYKGYKKMKYLTENERLDDGLCPKCETELEAAKHNGGSHDDKHAVCPKCGWEDDAY